MLKDRGLLWRDGETWRLDATDVEVPETVQGIIAARLDALGRDEKTLLQAAAVVGKVFWLGSVAAIADISDRDAEERLHALERKEFVRRDRRASVAGETEYAVRHVLVRDVAYGQVPRARRADLHVRAAHWIEALGEGRSEDQAEMLAHHYLSALELTRAAGGDSAQLQTPARLALREAGKRAYALSALESAANLYGKAIELWPKDDSAYPRLLFELGNALYEARNEGGSELHEAADRLLAAGDIEGAAEAESKLAHRSWFTGVQQEARAHSQRSVQLIADLPETRTTAAIRSYAWRLQLLQGEIPSLEEGRRLLAVTEELGTIEDILNGRITLAMSTAFVTGDIAGAIDELESVLEDAMRANSWVAARAYNNLATFAVAAGELGRSAEFMRAGVEVARRFTSRLEPWLEAGLIQDDYYNGSWDRGIDAAQRFIAYPGAAPYMVCPLHGMLAVMAAARGDRAGADAHAAACIDQAREVGDPQMLQPSLGRCALLALDAGGEAAARGYIDELVATLSTDITIFGPDMIEGCVAAVELGMGAGLGASLARVVGTNPWVEACVDVVEGRLEDAAVLLHAAEDYPDAALVRLLAAERVGRETPGLRDAVDFYESVGATALFSRARHVSGRESA